jgi:hypothetical protein
MTGALFATVTIVLLAGALGVACRRRAEPADSAGPPSRSETAPAVQPSPPESFGYKCAWLAIRGRSLEQVVAALPLHSARRANWREGIAVAYGGSGEVFVSPPVDGWIFVVGLRGLPGPGDSKHADEIVPFVTRLSRDLDTSVQFFFTHRIVETHVWGMAAQGKLVRAFGYSGEQGETLLDVGAPTDAEKALNPAERAKPNEKTVMRVAGQWGIDPQTLEQRDAGPGAGWIGKIR